jgi:hypothetical protein
MCDKILHQLDKLIVDLAAVLDLSDEYEEYTEILETLLKVVDEIKEDCDAVALDESTEEGEEEEEEIEEEIE